MLSEEIEIEKMIVFLRNVIVRGLRESLRVRGGVGLREVLVFFKLLR